MPVSFSNPGEIDPRLITTFGVNVKPNSTSPIGYFGTGLKYAIAVSLRLGLRISIISGKNKFSFSTRDEEIRGKTFSMVYMGTNGNAPKPLGFTLELGKNWKLWMVYRELYCNAIDEGGKVELSQGTVTKVPGYTTVLVIGSDFEKIHLDSGKYILQTKPLATIPGFTIHPGSTRDIFYRGIRVGQWKKPGKFTYNITMATTLTEDRTLSSTYTQEYYLMAALASMADQDILKEILVSEDGPDSEESSTLEGGLEFHNCSSASQTFLTTARGIIGEKRYSLHKKIFSMVKNLDRANIKPQAIMLDSKQESMLNEAKRFLGKLNYLVEVPIIMLEDLGTGIYASWESPNIILTPACFTQDQDFLNSILLEEHFHAKYGYRDETREFQSFLHDQIIRLGHRCINQTYNEPIVADYLQGDPEIDTETAKLYSHWDLASNAP